MTEGGISQAGLGPGSRVAGYLIEEQVGAGGMAIVFRATDEMLGRAAALKVMSPRFAEDAEFRARFIRESRAIGALEDPHIIPVYAAGDADGVLYIASKFVAGGDLAGLLSRNGGFLAADRTAALVSQVASALDAAHAAGMVHRDVKLANILVETLPGGREHAYLSDFGLTKGTSATTTGLTAAGQFMGTPDYCAPEQITGAMVDGRADQYALACAAFAMLTGTPPYQKPDPVASLFSHLNDPIPAASARRAGIPPAVDAVLARGMAKAPAERYATCAEFAAALRGAASGAAASGSAAPGPAYQPTEFATPYPPPTAVAYAPPVQSYTPPAPPYIPPAYPQPSPYPAPYAAPAAAPAPAGYVPPGGYLPAGGAAPTAGYAPPAGYAQPGGYNSPPFGSSPPFGGSPPFGSSPPLGTAPGLAGPPGYPISVPPAGRPRRKTGLIVGVSVAVLAAAGIGTGVALSGSSSPPPGGNGGGGGQQRALTYTMATMTAPLRAPGNNTAEAAFSQDGRLLVTDEFDNKLTVDSFFVWDTASRKHLRTLSLPGDYVSASNPVVSADDQSVTEMAIRSYPSPAPVQVYRWDLTTGKRTTVLTVNSPEKTWSTVFATSSLSGDGSKLLIEAAGGHGIDVWDVSGGQKITTLTQPGAAAIVGDDVSADGSVAGVGDADGRMYVWDIAAQQLKGTFRYAYKAPVKDGIPAFPGLSPDGKQVIVFGNGGPVSLWDVATGANITPHDARWAAQRGWQYSPDGTVIATEGETPTRLELWDAATRAHLFTIPFTGGVRAWVYAISSDNKELFTVGVDAKGSDTGMNYLWNLR